jgi:exopolyphosphatase / guanosine-5'-triphosphate,3'-diphosphate pyrophosphatase
MTIASVDIGTNTVLLLIAEVDSSTNKIVPLINEYRMPRIGQGTKLSEVISREKLTLLYEVLNEYKSIINRYNCEKIILTGTNAFRLASNTFDVIKEIKKSFDFDLTVISGEEEAEYAYLGTISNLDSTDNLIVIDIGGSSTEIIHGNSYKILSKNSLQLGSVSGTEQFLKSSPPLKTEIENFNREIINQFSAIEKKIASKQVIAIAGTATTIACMKLGLKEFEEDLVDRSPISIQDMKTIIDELSFLKTNEILKKYGSVMTGREDIIFAGAFILFQFMKHFSLEKIKVSTRGIRYGAIVKYLNNMI